MAVLTVLASLPTSSPAVCERVDHLLQVVLHVDDRVHRIGSDCAVEDEAVGDGRRARRRRAPVTNSIVASPSSVVRTWTR